MNYLIEIKLFYDWLETNHLTTGSIALWHALMQIANRSGWKSPLSIPLSSLEIRTGMPRSTLYRERDKLKKLGLIDFTTKGGRSAGRYVINPFGNYLVSHSEKQIEETQQFASQCGKQNENGDGDIPQFVSHGGNIYKLNNITNKENIKRKNLNEIVVGAEAPHTSTNPTPERKEKSCAKKEKKRRTKQEQSEFTHYALQEGGRPKVKVPPPLCDFEKWLEGVEESWAEVMRKWLEYKASRKERYKSEMSATKCLEQLKKLSAGDPKVAQEVVDQSIANNWAGLFELKRQSYYGRGQPMPARGQHIGQIKQPESEEARQRILDKFKPQPIKHKP